MRQVTDRSPRAAGALITGRRRGTFALGGVLPVRGPWRGQAQADRCGWGRQCPHCGREPGRNRFWITAGEATPARVIHTARLSSGAISRHRMRWARA